MNTVGPSAGEPTRSAPIDVFHAAAVQPIRRAERHEEIVRMLIVDQRRAQVAFAGLERLRRSAEGDPLAVVVEGVEPLGFPVVTSRVDEPANRPRLEREHAEHGEASRADRALAGEHHPVL